MVELPFGNKNSSQAGHPDLGPSLFRFNSRSSGPISCKCPRNFNDWKTIGLLHKVQLQSAIHIWAGQKHRDRWVHIRLLFEVDLPWHLSWLFLFLRALLQCLQAKVWSHDWSFSFSGYYKLYSELDHLWAGQIQKVQDKDWKESISYSKHLCFVLHQQWLAHATNQSLIGRLFFGQTRLDGHLSACGRFQYWILLWFHSKVVHKHWKPNCGRSCSIFTHFSFYPNCN